MSAATQYDALSHALSQKGSVQDPAEIHGTLSGILCVREDADPHEALEDAQELELTAPMAALREVILESLFDSESGFMLLLPGDDAAPLAARVKALARWCSGFVYGLASQPEFDLQGLSPEVQEVIQDITELGRAAITADDASPEGAERDYAELVEYVRVGVQLVFLELRPARQEDAQPARLH